MSNQRAGTAIRMQGLTKEYRDASRTLRVLENASFEFRAGGRYSVMGRSGVGKSTLLHILGGLDRPTSGKLWYGEQEISTLHHDQLAQFRGKHVGFVFQFHQLLAEFSAWENVAMPLFIAGIPEQDARQRAEALLVKVGMAERLTHRPGELSGGEQQRVAIARALVAGPSVLLADEPTGNLDHKTAQEIQTILLELQHQTGFTLIAVTHQREFADGLGEVLEMQPGGALTLASR